MFVSLKDLEDNVVSMKKEEYTKIFEVVASFIEKNADIDTEDEEEISKLRNEIEIGSLTNFYCNKFAVVEPLLIWP
jgi:hypothetical protein